MLRCPSLELVIFTLVTAVFIFPLSCILVSYGHTGVSIMRIPSTKRICKALSTCDSHLSVVSLFYGKIMALYLPSSTGQSHYKDIIVPCCTRWSPPCWTLSSTTCETETWLWLCRYFSETVIFLLTDNHLTTFLFTHWPC